MMRAVQARSTKKIQMAAVLGAAAVAASMWTWTSLTSANAATTTLAGVLATSGANLDTNYAIPSGAVFVAPTGSDGAAGTQAAPLATLQAAINTAPSGGTVVMRGGTYRQGDASANKALTIQAYPHEKPVLDGSDVISAWTASGNVWRTTSWKSSFGQNDFRPHEVGAGTAAGKVEQAYRNGAALTQVLTQAELAPGKFWVDPSSLQLYVADNPNGATMELANRVRALTVSGSGSKILGIRFTRYAIAHLDNSGMLANNASNSLMENDWFDHSSGAGVKISGSNVTVNHITAELNAAEGMAGNRNHNSVVENNQFLNNNSDNFLSNGCTDSCTVAGFKTAHTDNLKVINNAFVDNNANGYWCDLGCSNGTITGNAVTGSYDGIMYEVSSKALISNNYVANSDKGIRISGSDHATITDNTLVNNVFQFTLYDDSRSSSFDAYAASLGQTWNVTDTVVTGNTVIGGPKTTMLWVNSATTQNVSSQQLANVSGNTVSGVQKMQWCPAAGQCKAYNTVAEWAAVSGQPFGSVASGPITGANVPTTAPSTTTTRPPATTTTTAVDGPPVAPAAPTAPATPASPTTPTGGGTLLSTGFESASQWNPFGNATVSGNSDKKHSGTSSIVVKSVSPTPAIAGATASPNPIRSTVAGKTYSSSCWVKSHTQVQVRARFQEYNSNWVRVADPVVGAAVTTTDPSYWYKVSISYTADRSGVQLPFTVYASNLSNTTEPLYIDDCTVTSN